MNPSIIKKVRPRHGLHRDQWWVQDFREGGEGSQDNSLYITVPWSAQKPMTGSRIHMTEQLHAKRVIRVFFFQF